MGASAQGPPVPVIGFVCSISSSPVGAGAQTMIAFQQGPIEGGGYVEGRNVAIQLQFAAPGSSNE